MDASSQASNSQEAAADRFIEQLFIAYHIKIQGLRSHLPELGAVLKLMIHKCFASTRLDESIGHVKVEGYKLIARWDHVGPIIRERRYVCICFEQHLTKNITFLSKSVDAERIWFLLHTERGQFFFEHGTDRQILKSLPLRRVGMNMMLWQNRRWAGSGPNKSGVVISGHVMAQVLSSPQLPLQRTWWTPSWTRQDRRWRGLPPRLSGRLRSWKRQTPR